MSILLEDLTLCRLREAEIHHLVHEFVNDDEVVANRLLLEFFEVLHQYLDKSVKKQNDFCSIGVSFGQREDFKHQ